MSWACIFDEAANPDGATRCEVCDAPRFYTQAEVENICICATAAPDIEAIRLRGLWTCFRCEEENAEDRTVCRACGTERFYTQADVEVIRARATVEVIRARAVADVETVRSRATADVETIRVQTSAEVDAFRSHPPTRPPSQRIMVFMGIVVGFLSILLGWIIAQPQVSQERQRLGYEQQRLQAAHHRLAAIHPQPPSLAPTSQDTAAATTPGDIWQPARETPTRTTALAERSSFGSQTLLERLWTPQQLQGSPYDTRIVRLRVPDEAPPAEGAASLLPPVSPHGAIRRMKPAYNRQLVALTFNLYERADEVTGYDASIVNYLRTEQVRATFFAGGKWMRSHPEKAMQLMADPLFEVGNHGWTHENLRVLTGESLASQIRWTQDQYALLWEELKHRALREGLEPYIVEQEMAQIPHVPLIFRFPYGTCSPEALQVVNSQGLQAIQWDVVSGDSARPRAAHEIAQTVLRRIKPGSIVIFHANGRGYETAAALPHIIPALRTRGFEFVTVSELLLLGEDTVAPWECYELKPGDNRHYDALVSKGTSR